MTGCAILCLLAQQKCAPHLPFAFASDQAPIGGGTDRNELSSSRQLGLPITPVFFPRARARAYARQCHRTRDRFLDNSVHRFYKKAQELKITREQLIVDMEREEAEEERLFQEERRLQLEALGIDPNAKS